jgi:hypothetical protein
MNTAAAQDRAEDALHREELMRKRLPWLVLVVAAAALAAGCAIPRPRFADPGNPLKRVAVLPMKNDTDDVDGPNTVRGKMVEALRSREYVVLDPKETDQVLRDRMGINLGGQLDLTTPQKLGETLGVEGVLYGQLMDFGEVTTGVYNARKVRARFQLVNTATGQPCGSAVSASGASRARAAPRAARCGWARGSRTHGRKRRRGSRSRASPRTRAPRTP